MKLVRSNKIQEHKERVSFSPFLPQTISELLPDTSEEDQRTTFVAIGPILIESLANGDSLQTAADKARLHINDAARLLATPKFQRYVEAYLTLGDLLSREQRVRLSKTILASLIADGRIASSKRDALDYLEHIRRETESKGGRSSGVAIQIINNGTVPRPYTQIKEVKTGE